MNPFHLLKAVFVSLMEGLRRVGPSPHALPETGPAPRRPRRPLPPSVKWAFTALLAAAAVALVAVQFRRSLGDQPPAWLKVQEQMSPPLPSAHYKALHEEWEREAARRRMPPGSLRLLVLPDTNGVAMLWSTEPMVNPGFAPIDRVDRRFQPRREEWVGYYRLDGTPMRYTRRTNPSQTNATFVSLHLDQPLAPGATQTVLRVNKVNLRFRPNRAGNLEVWQGRLPPSPTLSAAGVVLPPKAECVRFAPLTGARRTEGETTLLSWLSSRVESNSPAMSVEFKLLAR